ncbi:hypothetical protein CRUP_014024 [Coryphaenoides rupestris]|nr:hypothetical protein CRUP_014024 [Coryphaenoides rupestris]
MEVFDDSSSSPSGTLRNYPLTCKVLYSYKARNKTGQVGYVPEKYLQFPTSSSLLSMLQSLSALDARSHTSSNSTEPELHTAGLNGELHPRREGGGKEGRREGGKEGGKCKRQCKLLRSKQ